MSDLLTIGMPTSSFLPNLGGAEVGLHNIATRITSRGHRAVVFMPSVHHKDLQNVGWNLPYKTVSFPPKLWGILRHTPRIGYGILDKLFGYFDKAYNIDVWHGTFGYPIGTALAHYATKRKCPHLVRCVGEDIQLDDEIGYGFRQNSQIDKQIRKWLPQSDRLIAITESMADEYRAIGVADSKISHIPNGVDLERFLVTPSRTRVRRNYGIPPDVFLFLSVGRNHPKKRYPDLLKAAATLPESVGHLALVGTGVSDLTEQTRALGINHRVHLIETLSAPRKAGNQLSLPADSLVQLYRSADVFVFPSRLESFGIALVEAMAAALPIITTDAPGCRDIVRENIDGLTIPADDVLGLARAMQQVHDDGNLRAQLSEAAQHRAARFSWDVIVDAYIALYRTLLAENSGSHFAKI